MPKTTMSTSAATARLPAINNSSASGTFSFSQEDTAMAPADVALATTGSRQVRNSKAAFSANASLLERSVGKSRVELDSIAMRTKQRITDDRVNRKKLARGVVAVKPMAPRPPPALEDGQTDFVARASCPRPPRQTGEGSASARGPMSSAEVAFRRDKQTYLTSILHAFETSNAPRRNWS